jgi:hypothetical protein
MDIMPEHDLPTSTTSQDDAHIASLARTVSADPAVLERLQTCRETVHETLHDQFRVVTSDLEQLRGILSDAASKLSGAFSVMNASTSELNATVRKLQETPELPALVRLTEIAEGMTSTTGMTVQSLQFEDMATQLLQHVSRRLAILESFSKDVAVIHPTPDHTPPYLTQTDLDTLEATVAHYRQQLDSASHKAVQQQSLDSGDIELF